MMDSMAGRKDTQVNPHPTDSTSFLLIMFLFWDIEPKIQTFLDLLWVVKVLQQKKTVCGAIFTAKITSDYYY